MEYIIKVLEFGNHNTNNHDVVYWIPCATISEAKRKAKERQDGNREITIYAVNLRKVNDQT